jgi:tetratricopeptide (TPR) repeat protein
VQALEQLMVVLLDGQPYFRGTMMGVLLDEQPKQVPEQTRCFNLAIWLEANKDHDGAEAMYKRLLELQPDHVNTLGNYANLLTGVRQDHDGAEAMYKRVLELVPETHPFHAFASRKLAALRQPQGAGARG